VVVRQIFAWVGRERLSMGEVARRLIAAGVPRRTSTAPWDRSLVYSVCKNPAYKGTAFSKTRVGPLRPQLRPRNSSGRVLHARQDGGLPAPFLDLRGHGKAVGIIDLAGR
jgi:site-specific DNA recombinase